MFGNNTQVCPEQGLLAGKISIRAVMKKEWKDRDWVQWLLQKFEFPFEVERVDDYDEYALYGKSTKNKPFGLGHIFKAVSVEDLDDTYSLILKCREGRSIGYVPLLDLELTDKDHKNNECIDEFLTWHAETQC